MRSVQVIDSPAAPLLLDNIDTDVICPMKRILKNAEEMGKYIFESLRYVGGDGDLGVPDENFPLNRPRFRDASIMITGDNFGCGSSRENAAEGIALFGIQCLIGSSFGGIFFRNCVQNGILPVILPADTVERIAAETEQGNFTVDLFRKTIRTPSGEIITFDLAEHQRQSLLYGLDQAALTLREATVIQEYQRRDRTERPWVYVYSQCSLTFSE